MSEFIVNREIDASKFRRYHTTLAVLLLLATLSNGINVYAYGTTMALITEEFKLTAATAGLVASINMAMGFVSTFIFGVLSDIIGYRKSITIGLALYGCAAVATIFTASPEMFVVCRFICGLGQGGTMPVVMALASQVLPAKNRSTFTACIGAGMQLGALVVAACAMFLIPAFGWRSVYCVAACTLLLIPAILAIVPEAPAYLYKKGRMADLKKTVERITGREIPADMEIKMDESPAKSKAKFSDVFKNPVFVVTMVLMWVAYFANYVMNQSIGQWLPTLLTSTGMALTAGLAFTVLINASGLVGTFVMGVISERVGIKNVLVFFNALCFVAMAVVGFTSNTVALTVLIIIAGFSYYGGGYNMHAYINTLYPHAIRGTATSITFTIGRLGTVFGPMMMGYCVNAGLSSGILFTILGAPALVTAIMIAFTKPQESGV